MASKVRKGPPRPGTVATQIRANCRSDDNQVRVKFDAVGWFAANDDAAIRKLHASGYKGEVADEIAYFVVDAKADSGSSAKPSPVAGVFRYLDTFRPRTPDGGVVGFEVTVNPQDVAEWLDRRRPGLRAELFPAYVAPEIAAC